MILKRHIDLSPDEQVFYWKNLERLGHYRGCSPNKKFHYHLLSHNAESAHGHKSPLHLDLWVEGIGMIFVDSGGPYRYSDKLRYSWFMAQKPTILLIFSIRIMLMKNLRLL